MFSLPGMLRVVINEDFVFVVVVFFSQEGKAVQCYM